MSHVIPALWRSKPHWKFEASLVLWSSRTSRALRTEPSLHLPEYTYFEIHENERVVVIFAFAFTLLRRCRSCGPRLVSVPFQRIPNKSDFPISLPQNGILFPSSIGAFSLTSSLVCGGCLGQHLPRLCVVLVECWAVRFCTLMVFQHHSVK